MNEGVANERAISAEDQRNGFGRAIDSNRRLPEIAEVVKVTYVRQSMWADPRIVGEVLKFQNSLRWEEDR